MSCSARPFIPSSSSVPLGHHARCAPSERCFCSVSHHAEEAASEKEAIVCSAQSTGLEHAMHFLARHEMPPQLIFNFPSQCIPLLNNHPLFNCQQCAISHFIFCCSSNLFCLR
eukprot:939796-Rhodomonas_salina.1